MTPESIKVGDLVVPHPVLGHRYLDQENYTGQVLTVVRSDYRIQVEHATRMEHDDIHHFYFIETDERYPTYIICCRDENGETYQGFDVRFQLVNKTVEYQLEQQLDAEEDLL